jgi:hypothetical protein
MKAILPVAEIRKSALPAGVKARRQSTAMLRFSIMARTAIDSPPNRPRQNSTIQMSIGTVRAKKPEVLQATAEASTSATPIARLRSESAAALVSIAAPLMAEVSRASGF